MKRNLTKTIYTQIVTDYDGNKTCLVRVIKLIRPLLHNQMPWRIKDFEICVWGYFETKTSQKTACIRGLKVLHWPRYWLIDPSQLPIKTSFIGYRSHQNINLPQKVVERFTETTHDRNAVFNFSQWISIAIQRGYAASILDTLPSGDDMDLLG